MTEMIRPVSRDANFHTAEYELLYSEIGENFRLAFQVAIYTLIANGFIMAWVAQSGKEVFSGLILQIAGFVPVLLTIFAFTLYRFLIWRSGIIYEYLFKIEQQVAGNGLGWEHYYRELKTKGRSRLASRRTFYALFIIQLFFAIAFALIVFEKFGEAEL